MVGFRAGRYPAAPRSYRELGVRYERQTFADLRTGISRQAGASVTTCAATARPWCGRLRHLLFVQIVDNTAANWALTGPAASSTTPPRRQVGFPASVTAAPLPAFPTGAAAPLRSLYVRPGDKANLNQYFPHATPIGYQDKLLNPYAKQ